jgi:hypothetical protein
MIKNETKISRIVPGEISGPTRKKQMKISGKFIPFKINISKKEKRAFAINDDPINLYMEVSEKDWPRLQTFVSDHPEQFADQFKTVMIDATPEKYPGERKRFINTLKKEVAILDEYCSYWCKRNFSEWPNFLQELIRQAEKDEFPINIKAKNTQKQKHMIEYCIKRLHGVMIKKYKLNPFGEANLPRTYILDGRKDGQALNILKGMMEKKTPSEIGRLVSGPHALPNLQRLFKKLNIL